MKTLFAKISTISLFILVCLCSTLELKAAQAPKEDWFLIEAKFSKRGNRVTDGSEAVASESRAQVATPVAVKNEAN